MYYVMRASAPSLHRESTDSLIYIYIYHSHIPEMMHFFNFLGNSLVGNDAVWNFIGLLCTWVLYTT